MIRKKKYLGAAGDYAKYELACIKALAKLLKQTYKKTLQTVNLDDSLLKIISVNFDKKVTVKETAKELKAALIKVAKKNPLESFIEILSKLPKKQTETIKPKFPIKLPATVTIGANKKHLEYLHGLHTDKKSHNTRITVISGVNKWHKELQTLSYDIIRHNNYKDNLIQALKDPKFKKAAAKKTWDYKAIKSDLAQTNAYIKYAKQRYNTLLTLLGKPIG